MKESPSAQTASEAAWKKYMLQLGSKLSAQMASCEQTRAEIERL
jgi:hypothetical protein